jgi:phosphotransferase system enzyme I (PtsI)
MKTLDKGQNVSLGIGIGKAYIYKRYESKVEEAYIEAEDAQKTFDNYLLVKASAMQEIQKIFDFLEAQKDEKAKIFRAHLDIIDDVAIDDEISSNIKEMHYDCGYAIDTVYDMFIEMLSQVEDELIRERVADLKDVKLRLLRILDGVVESNLALLDENRIVIANDLYPSDTATIDRNHVKGIVTEIGGKTSHTAIIAKSYEIPAILGVTQAMDIIKHDDMIILDATSNQIIINPDEKTLEEYQVKQKAAIEAKEKIKAYLDKPSKTKDGVKVELALNIGSASEEELSFEPYVDGVGLFRSEFLYMESDTMPSEEKQFRVYKKTLSEFAKKPVILRTLDIGGDKTLKYMELPKEDNPFLGKRAIRLCFDHMEMFKTQLRAALRASVFGNLWLMFPMVGSVDDILRLRDVFNEVKKELDDKNIAYKDDVKFGVMIEIPALIMISDIVSQIVDFASIGTNDLTQYLTAVDRMNPDIASYYQNYAPSIFRTMKMAADYFNKANKPLSVCGELGGDLIGAPLLIGMGIKKLSMNQSSIAPIKQMIGQYTSDELKEMAEKALNMHQEKDIKKYVLDEHKKKGVIYV